MVWTWETIYNSWMKTSNLSLLLVWFGFLLWPLIIQSLFFKGKWSVEIAYPALATFVSSFIQYSAGYFALNIQMPICKHFTQNILVEMVLFPIAVCNIIKHKYLISIGLYSVFKKKCIHSKSQTETLCYWYFPFLCNNLVSLFNHLSC